MAKKVTAAGVESNKDWQAESDARTLMEAEVIKKDSKRFNAALKAADRMADDKKKESDAMSKVAGLKTKKKINGV